ncbi:histone H1-delta [Biomphalaria pfeifferi]|uniref:Histone H1-delta n=1 Tax=Biomphalaria pfeifferi TaxID=112525 RepID=A0AAD8EX35_BIOPF|nr:histone H1-delta [Biomphalaria pfeifferi]
MADNDTAAAPAPAPVKTPKKKAAAKPQVPAAHPQYKAMIQAAIVALKERGGSSRQAILKYIAANYKVGDNPTAINARLKAALKAGVKAGTLKQSKGTGAAGSFRLGEKKAEKKPKAKKVAVKKPKSPKKAAAAKPKKAAGAKKAATKSPRRLPRSQLHPKRPNHLRR